MSEAGASAGDQGASFSNHTTAATLASVPAADASAPAVGSSSEGDGASSASYSTANSSAPVASAAAEPSHSPSSQASPAAASVPVDSGPAGHGAMSESSAHAGNEGDAGAAAADHPMNGASSTSELPAVAIAAQSGSGTPVQAPAADARSETDGAAALAAPSVGRTDSGSVPPPGTSASGSASAGAAPAVPQLERSSATPVPPPSTSTAIATTSRTKLPPSTATPLSRVGKLRRRIEQDELDGDAWLSLIADAQKKGDLEGARETYNAFFKVYPDAAQQWISFADLELQHNNFSNVEAIFGRCLRHSTSVALWRFYLNYIRRVNPINVTMPEQSATSRAVITKGFEFALNHVGQDRSAGELWHDYIKFLKEGQGHRGEWEDQQRMDALRKAFQRAVCIPLENVETIWHDYNQFENSISKMTAKKFLQERSPAYMTARTVRRELSNFVSRLPEPALPHRPDWSRSDDREGIEAWKRYIAYEESNPLMLEDQAALRLRVQYAMRKARAALRFFPEIWFVAANYSFRNNRTDEGAKLLREGRAANPSSMLLAYSLIDFEENRRDYPTCHAIYDSLTTHYHGELTKQTTAIEAEVGEATNAVDAQLEVEIKRETADGEGNLQVRAAEERREIEAAIRGKHQRSVEATQQALSSVWVSEMRFTRRAEGMKPFRTVFTKIRKTGVLTRQVFEASAMIELHWNKDAKVATNVFELGLKTFADDPAYVLPYLDYLLSSGNESNARALFEKTVSRIEAPKAKAIWDRWAKHEYANSDQSAIQKFFERYSEAFPDTPLVDRFVQRHGGFDTNEALAQEIGAADVPMSRRGSGVDSPMRIKRPLSPEPLRPVGQPALARGDANGPGAKRAKMQHARPSPSPAPSDDGHGDASHGRGAPPSGPRGYASPRPESEPQAVYFLSDRRDTVGHLPEGVAFFLSVLPAASSFDGPQLNAVAMGDIIATTPLPATPPTGPRGGGLRRRH